MPVLFSLISLDETPLESEGERVYICSGQPIDTWPQLETGHDVKQWPDQLEIILCLTEDDIVGYIQSQRGSGIGGIRLPDGSMRNLNEFEECIVSSSWIHRTGHYYQPDSPNALESQHMRLSMSTIGVESDLRDERERSSLLLADRAQDWIRSDVERVSERFSCCRNLFCCLGHDNDLSST